METILTHLEAAAPTIVAIIGLVLFTPRTRLLSYIAIVLAIITEMIPFTINTTGLLACTACLVAVLLSEVLQLSKLTPPVFNH